MTGKNRPDRRLSYTAATVWTCLCVVAACVLALMSTAFADAATRPTIVLVHGAFADQTSWDGVAADLRHDGYRVLTPVNPLRSPSYDAAAVERTVREISGPVVLVGHSYGGAVITNIHDARVVKLVYIAAFAPAAGEPISFAIDPLQFPGSRLVPPALALKVVPDPTTRIGVNLDGYIEPSQFKEVFAQDVDDATVATMIAHQRSIAAYTNIEPSGPPSWATTPSWYLVSRQDRVIPPAAERFYATRMHAHTREIDSSHASLVAHPAAVADFIAGAAAAS